MPNQHIKPEDRSPALARYYRLKGTPEGERNAQRQRELDAKRRADPEMKKHIAATSKVWYDEGGGREKRKTQYKKVKDNGWLKKRRDDRQQVLLDHLSLHNDLGDGNGPIHTCEECGITDVDQHVDWHFDHTDPKTKSHNLNRQDSYKKSFKELIKCQLLCYDCHLKKTFVNDLPVIMEKKYGSK